MVCFSLCLVFLLEDGGAAFMRNIGEVVGCTMPTVQERKLVVTS
jgi:hypothetical protein